MLLHVGHLRRVRLAAQLTQQLQAQTSKGHYHHGPHHLGHPDPLRHRWCSNRLAHKIIWI